MTEATVVVETTDLAAYDSKLPAETHRQLVEKFSSYSQQADELVAIAETIEVTSAQDTEEIELARRTRLDLQKVRTSTDKTRKAMKEEALLYGRALDGIANIIKFKIVPAEKVLQEMEDFAKHEEEERIAALVAERTSKLEAYEVDVEDYDLGSMTDKAFNALLENSKLGYQARKDAAIAEQKREEEARLAAEKAAAARKALEAAEREKMRVDNEKLQAKAAKEQAARKKAEAEAKALKQAEVDRMKADLERREKEAKEEAQREAEAKQAELDAMVAALDAMVAAEEAEQRALAAPDKEKLVVLVETICDIKFPSVSSDVAREAIDEAGVALTNLVKALRVTIDELGE